MSEKKRWIGAKVSDQLFDAINAYASELGMHPGKLLPKLLEEGLKAKASQAKSCPLQVRLWLAVTAQQERETMVQHLKNLFYFAVRDGDEQQLDIASKMAKEMGIPPAEIIKEIHTTEPSISITDDPTGVESCMQWLEELLAFNKTLPATYIRDSAEERGFSSYTLNQAKSRLPITSTRKSRHWEWAWETTPESEALEANKERYLAELQAVVG